MKKLRRHLSYANVAATLALLFAMTGSAIAAKHYLINSTKQINPKVLKKLKGQRGRTGFGIRGQPGPNGKNGAQGIAGSQGAGGPEGKEGPRGPSNVYEVALNTQVLSPAGTAKTLTLSNLPAGTYVISGRAGISPNEQKASPSHCELKAETEGDYGFSELTNLAGPEELAVITTQVTHTFASTGEVTMTCTASLVPWNLRTTPGTRIVAVRVESQHTTIQAAT
jgi:hypothetical protein